MENKVIILGSVTYALKAKDLLLKHGIKSYIERNKKTREYGCGYALQVPNNAVKAEKIILDANIKILAITEMGE